MTDIAERVGKIRERMAAAAARAGRLASDITLMAATKTRTVEEIAEVVRCGITDLGENYVQELLTKREAIDKYALAQVSWHMIGHLQRNKVKYLKPALKLIHSLDSIRLAEEINHRSEEAGGRQAVLIEVNLVGEDTKSGVNPAEVPKLADHVLGLPHLELQGLMTMPPYSEDPEDSRPHFRQLAGLAEVLRQADVPAENMRHLSMGMSGDFEVAVEEGATFVRLGTVLFGARPVRE